MRGIGFYGKDFFTIKKDKEFYAECIQRLLMTNEGERVGQPFFGLSLKDLLFELADNESVDNAKNKIYEQFRLYLPILDITKLEVTIDNNTIFFKLGFIEKGEPIEDERILEIEFAGVSE